MEMEIAFGMISVNVTEIRSVDQFNPSLLEVQCKTAVQINNECFYVSLLVFRFQRGIQSLSVSSTDSSPHTSGVSKIVTVDVKGSAPLWMKIKDLADGVTYNFRIRAKTLTYGPEIEANITTGPGEGTFTSHSAQCLLLPWIV